MKLTVDLFNPQEVNSARAIFDLLEEPIEAEQYEPDEELSAIDPEVAVAVEEVAEAIEEAQALPPPEEVKAKVPGKETKAEAPAPTTETVPALNDVKNAIRDLVRGGKMTRGDVETLLAEFNVKAVSELDDAARTQFYDKCKTQAGEVEDAPV